MQNWGTIDTIGVISKKHLDLKAAIAELMDEILKLKEEVRELKLTILLDDKK